MILDFVEVENFRNLSGKIVWGPGLNIIHGNNGQGKTNWLEAIYLLSRTKSFRTQRLQESIRFGQESAFVAGRVFSGDNLQRDLRITLRENTNDLGLVELQNQLAPWNQQLVSLAAEIHEARVDYTERLNSELERSLFEPAELHIRYSSSLDGKGDLNNYEALLSERLQLRLPAEASAGRALLGPHRDDLAVRLSGRELRVFGSSGQQRSALLLLDLAAISVYNSWHNDRPLFLVDDVDAELDEKRIRRLLEYLEGRTQTFITTSKRSHLEGFLSKANVHEIVEGEAVQAELHRSTFSAAATD